MLNVGIIGLGTIAPAHLAAIRSAADAKLTAVCDVKPEKANFAPEAHFYQDAETMLKREHLDVVHLCLPHYLHVPMALLANRYGVNVLTEKPLGLSAAEGRKLLTLPHPEKKVAVCFQNRYNNTTLALQAALAKSPAQIVGVRGLVHWHRGADYYAASPWRGQVKLAGSGSLSNQAIHTLDLMQLLGGTITSVQAQTMRLSQMPIEVEDSAVARFSYQNGAAGFFSSTNANAIDDSTLLEVVTETDRYTIQDGLLTLTPRQGGVSQVLAKDDLAAGYKRYYGPSHSRLIHAFYQSLETGEKDYVSVKEALVSMQLIDAIKACGSLTTAGSAALKDE